MGKVKDYVRNVKKAHRAVKDADDRLNAYEGVEYPEALNEEAWQAIERRRNAILGRRSR
jgi:hypothetical protein